MNSSRKTAICLILATICAYISSFRGGFQFDDYNVIVNYPPVHSLEGWLDDLGHGIRPLLKLTYTLNWISGFRLFSFHLTNLAIHTVNSLLIYHLALRLTKRHQPENAQLIASGTAFLFALHPVQTEAVTYICGRSSSLMALFYLGSLLLYIRGREEQLPFLHSLVSPLLFLCALGVKETAVTLPAALLLWESCNRKGNGSERIPLRPMSLHWLILICGGLLMLCHPRYRELFMFGISLRTAAENLHLQIRGIWYLLTRLFMFTSLSIDPDIPVAGGWMLAKYLQAGLLLALPAAGLSLVKRSPLVSFGILWLVLQLIPTNSIVPRLDPANERQMYLASLGPFLLAGAGYAKFRQWAPSRMLPFTSVCPAILLAILAAATFLRNYEYRSEIALWEATARHTTSKARVFNNLGYAYLLADRHGDAYREFSRALELDPSYEKARGNRETARQALEDRAFRILEKSHIP